MTRRQMFVRFILKWTVAALAVLNLIALFVFDYQIPGLSRLFSSGSAVTSETDASNVTSSGRLSIKVPSGDLQYSGKGTLDLTEGVTVLDASGNESDAQLTYVVYDGTSANEKRIEYSVSDSSGMIVTASRKLKLTGSYNGPSIIVRQNLPTFESSDLEVLVAVMTDRNLISAEDGLGGDITDQITVMYQPGASASTYLVTFSVENELGDSATAIATILVDDDDSDSEDSDVNSDDSSDDGEDGDSSAVEDEEEEEDGPVIRLSTDEVTISAGSSFNGLEYVSSAKDADGSDLFGNISIDGSVDTNTPGTYTLRFFCTNSAGEFSRVKTMTVYVE